MKVDKEKFIGYFTLAFYSLLTLFREVLYGGKRSDAPEFGPATIRCKSKVPVAIRGTLFTRKRAEKTGPEALSDPRRRNGTKKGPKTQIGVITSYSIHYTKLYDTTARSRNARARWLRASTREWPTVDARPLRTAHRRFRRWPA